MNLCRFFAFGGLFFSFFFFFFNKKLLRIIEIVKKVKNRSTFMSENIMNNILAVLGTMRPACDKINKL